MALKDTMNKMKALLEEVLSDLEKSERGNKAAAQRTRTGTIKLAKLSKVYRQESLASEKKGSSSKKSVAKTKPRVVKSAPLPKRPKLHVAPPPVTPMRRATAKIPSRRR